jgi:2-octaprenyl-6-methoxyphenol hydroxylase
MRKDRHHDAVIVGGGLAGLVTALSLAHYGARVALIDRESRTTRLEERFDGRTSAVAYANFRMMSRLGLGERLAPHAQPIRTIMITDGKVASLPGKGGAGPFWLQFLDTDLKGRPEGEPLGWMLENRHMRLALFEAIARHPGAIDVYDCSQVVSHTRAPSGVEVTLGDGQRLCGDLLIAADGVASGLAKAARIRRLEWSYGQSALVATIAHEKPHDAAAYEHFLPGGPFAILPLTEHRSSIVWTEKDQLARALHALDDHDFLNELNRRLGDFLGPLQLASPRWVYPLHLSMAEDFAAERLVLVGDAARKIHPIAGQGFNLGLKDAAALGQSIGEGLKAGLHAGDHEILARYQRWRRFDSVSLVASTDLFTRLYSNDIAPVRLARGLGMSALRALPVARNLFTRHAGAEIGDLPELLKA